MAVFLDRRISSTDTGVNPTYNGTATVWTLPYSIATDGSEGVVAVVRKDTEASLTVTRPSATTVAVTGATLVAVPMWIGVTNEFSLEFSVIYPRDERDTPVIRGRTNLRYLHLHYEDATHFVVTVTADGRSARTYTFTASTPESGTFTVPLQTRNTTVTITITSSTPGAAGFSGYEWEGVLYTRVR